MLLGLALAAGYYGLGKDLIVEKLAALPARTDEAIVADRIEPAVPPVALIPASEPEATIAATEQVVIDLRREGTG